MSWPTDDLSTANVDAGGDSPARARVDILRCFQIVKEIIAARGVAGGVASLDRNARVPDAQSGRGTANGVATLDGTTKVPNAQLRRGEADGLASLDATGKVPGGQLPSLWETGDVKVTAGTAAPTGWLIANGTILNSGTHETLRTFLGSRFKLADDPDGTVRLPDYQGNFILGASAARPVGTTGGEEEHTLTVDEMPSHTHGIGGNRIGANNGNSGGYARASTTWLSTPAGGGQPHNNMPPFVTALIIIKT